MGQVHQKCDSNRYHTACLIWAQRGYALEIRDLGVFEDGCERLDALCTKTVVGETAKCNQSSSELGRCNKCVIATAITHVQKASTTPQSGHIALLKSLAENCDALGRVLAVAHAIGTAELVDVQAVNNSTHMIKCVTSPARYRACSEGKHRTSERSHCSA